MFVERLFPWQPCNYECEETYEGTNIYITNSYCIKELSDMTAPYRKTRCLNARENKTTKEMRRKDVHVHHSVPHTQAEATV
jgi:hypothetical protein